MHLYNRIFRAVKVWLGDRDSNPNCLIQSHRINTLTGRRSAVFLSEEHLIFTHLIRVASA